MMTSSSNSSKTAMEWKAQGNAHYQAQEYKQALECYTQALTLEPDHAETYLFYSNRGQTHGQLGNWAEAAADAKHSLALIPADCSFPKGHYRLAKAYLELRQYGAANEALMKGITLFPNNNELRLLQQTLEKAKARELASIKTAKDPRKRVTPAELQTLGELGQGNFSRILHVLHRETGEHFALKVIEKSQMERVRKRHPNVANEISMERRILSRLRHPNVVELYHAFQDHTSLYLLLEYCDGGEVWQRLQADGGGVCSVGVPASLARFYALETLAALTFLHGKGIVHRDVKPENMVLTSWGRLKLIDFGSAKDTVETDLNGPEFVGTPEYMSPEAIGSKETLMEGDLWALGCCLFQFLVGLSPFRASSPYLVFLRSQRCNPRYPAVVPPLARDLISKLLRKRPEDRLGSFRSVQEEMRGHAAILAHPFLTFQEENEGEGEAQAAAAAAAAAAATTVEEDGGGPIVREATSREARLCELAAQCVTHAMDTSPPDHEFATSMASLSMAERATVLHLLERQGRLGEPRILRLGLLGLTDNASSIAATAKARLMGRVDWSGREVYGLGKADQGKYTGPFFFMFLGGRWSSGQDPLKELEKAVLAINRLRPRVVVASPAIWEGTEEVEEKVWSVLGRISESIPLLLMGTRGEQGGYGFWYGGVRGLVTTAMDDENYGKEEEDWLVEELEQAYYNDDHPVLAFTPRPWFATEGACEGGSGLDGVTPRLRKWGLGNMQGRETGLRAVLTPSLAASCAVEVSRQCVEEIRGQSSDDSSGGEEEEEEEGDEKESEGEGNGKGMEESGQGSSTKVVQLFTRDVCILEVYRDRLVHSFVTSEELLAMQKVELAAEAPRGKDEE